MLLCIARVNYSKGFVGILTLGLRNDSCNPFTDASSEIFTYLDKSVAFHPMFMILPSYLQQGNIFYKRTDTDMRIKAKIKGSYSLILDFFFIENALFQKIFSLICFRCEYKILGFSRVVQNGYESCF